MRVLLNWATRVERISRLDVSKPCRPPRHISPDQAASASPNAGAVCFDGTPGRKPQLSPRLAFRPYSGPRLSWQPRLSVPYHRNSCTGPDRFCDWASPAALPSEIRCVSLNSIALLAPTPPKRNMIAGRRWIRYRALIIPRRCFVCAGPAKVQWSGTVELRDLVVPLDRASVRHR